MDKKRNSTFFTQFTKTRLFKNTKTNIRTIFHSLIIAQILALSLALSGCGFKDDPFRANLQESK
ncbi:MAG: hypothetical protein SOW25_07880 [Helicobacter sp.]|nr:hypothetical protein [Helicobacteraceae bacterium]MDY3114223.1 hypothetical protein [Helicobacter sp.]